MSQLIRYESGQRGRYIYEGREVFWDTSEDPIKIVARGPEDQASLADHEFLEDMLNNLFTDLGMNVGDIEIN